MKLRRTKENILINDYKKNEEVANRYVIRCATSAMIITGLCGFLQCLIYFWLIEP